MRGFVPLALLGILVTAAAVAGLTVPGDDGLPGLSAATLDELRVQDVTFDVDDSAPAPDADQLARLVDAIRLARVPGSHQVPAASRGRFTYREPDQQFVDVDAWGLVVTGVEAKCYGGDMCPDPPEVGTQVWFVDADTLEQLGGFWVSPVHS